MKLNKEQVERMAKMDGIEVFLEGILDMMAEGGSNGAKIMVKRTTLHKKLNKIMDFVAENLEEFEGEENTDKANRFINFLGEIDKLFDEFIKGEDIK